MFALTVVVLLVASESWGQVNKSNLTGIVRDESGAAIPGVAIQAVNTATGAAVSDDNAHTVDDWFDITQFRPREAFTLRTLATRLDDLRGPGVNKWDFTISKSFRMSDGLALKTRVELYNAFNRTNFANPNTTVTSTSFGRITGTSFGGPREIQLAARLEF